MLFFSILQNSFFCNLLIIFPFFRAKKVHLEGRFFIFRAFYQHFFVDSLLFFYTQCCTCNWNLATTMPATIATAMVANKILFFVRSYTTYD